MVFGATTPELEALAPWKSAEQIGPVTMESTHVIRTRLYEKLEEGGNERLPAWDF